MNYVIETDRLTKRFGKKTAVNNLSIQVPEGSIFAFLGPNGAGKTTTIKMFANILEPTQGSARVLGRESTRLSENEFRQIGYVSENQKLPGWMTVNQLIGFCKPFYPGWDDAFCEKLRVQFDLPPEQKVRRLSRGMKMKAALLISLAYRPNLLILDEPFSGLDPLVRDEFIRGVLELSESERWTVFVSSHDIDEVERLADWVAVVNEGELTLAEPVASLQERFRSVEVAVDTVAPPQGVPASWLLVDRAAHAVRFVESAYRPGECEARIGAVFPGGRLVQISPMSLRDVFLALARTYRMAK